MELKCNNFFDNATHIRELGKGSYGSVHLIEKPNGMRYAVKYMYIKTEPEKIGVSKSTLLDIDSLIRLRNVPDVINVVRICYVNHVIGLIMEAMESDLHSFITKTSVYDRLRLTRKLLNTLIRVASLMETLNITHYDIKPQNILVNSNILGQEFKVTDFGLAEISFGSNIIPTGELYTLWYRPPEFLTDRIRTTFRVFAGDIWAIGITVLEFITGTPIFPGRDIDDVLRLMYVTSNNIDMDPATFNISNTVGTITGNLPIMDIIKQYISGPIAEQLDPQIINMLSKMLSLNPNNRPTGIQLLDEFNERINPYFLVTLLPPEYPRRIHTEGIENIIQISRRLNLSKASTLIAIEIFTRYLDILFIDLNTDIYIYIRALASLRIAEIFTETNPVETYEIVETYQLVCGLKCTSITNIQISEIEKDILERTNFQIYNLNLGPVIERAYSKNIDFQRISFDQFAEPLSRWLID